MMERPNRPRTANQIGREDNGITNCCAALRRLMERMQREPNFMGHTVIDVAWQNSKPVSYTAGLIVPPPP